MSDWPEDVDACRRRWPMAPNNLLPRERWLWWEQLWADVISLSKRYRIRLGHRWWEDDAQVETLAALAAWVERYDSGEWDDPPGKLALLYDLDRIRALIGGGEPFHPDRDYLVFARFLIEAGCQPPPDN
ncbi:MAG: hypothetical protein WCD11_21185 [Solirubrobacteraceae bacterium]